MPERKKLVVHIGYHNDTTNMLQVWLKRHRAVVEDRVLCISRLDKGPHPLAATAVAFSRGQAGRDALFAAAQDMARTVWAAPQPVACITNEDLLGRPLGFRTADQMDVGLYPKACGIVDALAEAFAAFDTTFVTVERAPGPWLRCRHEDLTALGYDMPPLPQFQQMHADRIDWEALRYEIAVGLKDRARHVALDYAREFHSGCVADMALLALLGLSPDTDKRLRADLGQFIPTPTNGQKPADQQQSFPPEVNNAFRVFLGRLRTDVNPPHYERLSDLHQRLATSAEFRASPRAVKTPLGWPLGQVFVSKPARILFCPIRQNASTLLKSEVVRSAGLPYADHLASDIHFITDHVRTGAQLADHTEEQATALIRSSEYLRVAVLQDPMARLLSAYTEKFVYNRLLPSSVDVTRTLVASVQNAQGFADTDFERGITFRDFITHVTDTDPDTLDPHWRPQALYLAGMNYDRFYPIDQIDRLLALIEKRSGQTLERPPREGADPGGRLHRPGAQDLLPSRIETLPRLSPESFFDETLRSAVETAYADDYALFLQTEGLLQ